MATSVTSLEDIESRLKAAEERRKELEAQQLEKLAEHERQKLRYIIFRHRKLSK